MLLGPCTIRVAAAELGVTEGTVRRWLSEGAPAVRPGACGRGRGALVNLEAIRQWLRARVGLDSVEAARPDVHQAIARGLLAAFKRGNAGESDPLWRQLGDRPGRAALLLAESYLAIIRAVDGREPIDRELPQEIHQLRAIAAQSIR